MGSETTSLAQGVWKMKHFKIKCKGCGHQKHWHGESGYCSQGLGPVDVIEDVCMVKECECAGWYSHNERKAAGKDREGIWK